MLFKKTSWATRFLMPLILTTNLVQAASSEQTNPLYSSQEVRTALTDLNVIGGNNVTNSLKQSDPLSISGLSDAENALGGFDDTKPSPRETLSPINQSDPLSISGLSDAENVLGVFDNTEPLPKETLSPIELDPSQLEAKDYALKVMVKDNKLVYHAYEDAYDDDYSEDDEPPRLKVFLVPINQKTITIDEDTSELITVREAQKRNLFTPNVLIDIVHSKGEDFIKDIISKNKSLEEDRELLREYSEKIPHFTIMPDGTEKDHFEQGEIYYNFDGEDIDIRPFDTKEKIKAYSVDTTPDFEIKLFLSNDKLFIPPDNVIYAWSMPKTSESENDLVTISRAFDMRLLTKDIPPIILIMKRTIDEVLRILKAPENTAIRHEFMLLHFLNDQKGVPIITTESGNNKKNLIIIDPSGEVINSMSLEEWKETLEKENKSHISPLSRSKSSEDLTTESKKDKKHHHSKSKHHHQKHHKRSKSSEDFATKDQEKMPTQHHARSPERHKVINLDAMLIPPPFAEEEMKALEQEESPLTRSKSADTPRDDEKTKEVAPLTRKNSLPPLPSKERVKEKPTKEEGLDLREALKLENPSEKKGMDLSDALKLEKPSSGRLASVKSFLGVGKKKPKEGGQETR